MTQAEKLDALQRRLDETNVRLGILEDIHAVRTLHFKYGYYLDKCLSVEIVELYSEDCEIYFLGGLFRSKAGARRLYGGATPA